MPLERQNRPGIRFDCVKDSAIFMPMGKEVPYQWIEKPILPSDLGERVAGRRRHSNLPA
jgi:hypothetical protein